MRTPLIGVSRRFAEALLHPLRILLVELLRRKPEVLLNNLRCSFELRISVDHLQKLVVTPTTLDKVADTSCLKVGHNNLRRIVRRHEASIELLYRQQLLI